MAYTNECLKHQQHQHHCFSLGEGGRVTSIMGVRGVHGGGDCMGVLQVHDHSIW